MDQLDSRRLTKQLASQQLLNTANSIYSFAHTVNDFSSICFRNSFFYERVQQMFNLVNASATLCD